jgi:transposase InsO family protein
MEQSLCRLSICFLSQLSKRFSRWDQQRRKKCEDYRALLNAKFRSFCALVFIPSATTQKPGVVKEARMETFTSIESYYKGARRRSALGYQSPENFERAYYQRTEAREFIFSTALGVSA